MLFTFFTCTTLVKMVREKTGGAGCSELIRTTCLESSKIGPVILFSITTSSLIRGRDDAEVCYAG